MRRCAILPGAAALMFCIGPDFSRAAEGLRKNWASAPAALPNRSFIHFEAYGLLGRTLLPRMKSWVGIAMEDTLSDCGALSI